MDDDIRYYNLSLDELLALYLVWYCSRSLIKLLSADQSAVPSEEFSYDSD